MHSSGGCSIPAKDGAEEEEEEDEASHERRRCSM